MRTFNLMASESVCTELGARIKRLRLLRNLSQQQVADMTGASLSSLRRLEASGQTSLLLLVRVTQALHVTGQLDPLFQEEVQSIAQAERAAQAATRQRARTRTPTSSARRPRSKMSVRA